MSAVDGMYGDERKKRGDWLIRLLIVFVLAIPAGLGFFAYKLLTRPPAPPPALEPLPTATEAPTPVSTATPLPSGTPLPELDKSDAFIRDLVEMLSQNPSWATWLATEGLMRRFVVVVDNVAEGKAPTKFVGMLAPKQKFTAVERGRESFVDPKSYERYDLPATVIESLDTKGSAHAYRELKPLIDQAYRELGYPDQSFDVTLARAIDRLLATPIPPESVALKPGVKSFRYADPALEKLSPAQKQFMRLGPENMKKVQQKLRELRDELGLPPLNAAPKSG